MSSILDALINLWRLLRNARVRLLGRPPEYVWIEASGSLPEFEKPIGFVRRRLSPDPASTTLEGLRARLDRISADGRLRGVVLRVRTLDAGWAVLEELRRELLAFREGGGRVIVYLTDSVDTRSYYLACTADEVLATPLVTLNVTGVRARVNFFKDALDRIGLEAEVVAISPYKTAGDSYVRNDFSRESREQIDRLLDRRYGELTRAISEGRNISLEEARVAIDGAPYGARDALSRGLLDGVCYEDELPEKLGSDGRRARLSEWGVAERALRIPYRGGSQRRVGLVDVSGVIVRGKSRRLPVPLPFLGGEQAGSESVIATLRLAEKDRRVVTILLRVESPGGDALASDLIWREVERIRRKKPVVVLMGNVAASGGYYVSAPASHVVARLNTVTGSIGVLTVRPVAGKFYEKLGINPASVNRGARAGLLDVSRRPTPDELRVLERQIRLVYDEFKDRVARGRSIELQGLENVAGGRVYTGGEALEIGLVDEIGGFREALRKATELGGIGHDAPGRLVKISTPRAVRPAPGNPVDAARDVVGEMGRALSGLRADRVWALAPYEISED
jgi:protease-4